MAQEDHYSVLGLPCGIKGTDLSSKDIREAYKRKALEYHPDKRRNDPKAASLFQAIKTSYEVLMDESARKAHDDLIRLKHQRLEKANQVSAKRRKMMDRLAEEERAATFKTQTDKQKMEVERAKKKIEQEIARMRAMNEKKSVSTASSNPLNTKQGEADNLPDLSNLHAYEDAILEKLKKGYQRTDITEVNFYFLPFEVPAFMLP